MTRTELEERFNKAVEMVKRIWFCNSEAVDYNIPFELYDKNHAGKLVSISELIDSIDISPQQYRVIDIAVFNRVGIGDVIFVRPSNFVSGADWIPDPNDDIAPFKVLSPISELR
jgi:hypothetical protein